MSIEQRFSVIFEPSGLVFEAPARLPLLRSAREAGLILPSSCRNGTCRACLCRLVSGRVSYIVEWPGLSAEEKAEGFHSSVCRGAGKRADVGYEQGGGYAHHPVSLRRQLGEAIRASRSSRRNSTVSTGSTEWAAR